MNISMLYYIFIKYNFFASFVKRLFDTQNYRDNLAGECLDLRYTNISMCLKIRELSDEI